jgi:predicted transposase YdaD
MSKPFDTNLKFLIDEHLPNWVAFLGKVLDIPVAAATTLPADLPVTLNTDRLIRIETDPPYILHLEMQTSGALGMPDRMLEYNVLSYRAHKLPVIGVVMLLRPKDNPSDLTGELTRKLGDETILNFRYRVIRLWKIPFEVLCNAGPGVLPLAMLTDDIGDPYKAMELVKQKLRSDVYDDKMRTTDASALFFLLGLRFSQDMIQELLRVSPMILEESTTFQYVLGLGKTQGMKEGRKEGREEGREDATRSHILRVGEKRLGPASQQLLESLKATTDITLLEAAFDRVIDAASWDEVAATLTTNP